MPTAQKRDIRDLTRDEVVGAVLALGQPKFRSKQIVDWVFAKGVSSFDEMTNLPAALRQKLADEFELSAPQEVAKQVSKDGSRKYLLQFPDGVSVETVGMPNKDRLSVCVSTQAGCAMNCAFCATGMNGLVRSLTASEMLAQVLHVEHDLGQRVSSVVFMGQGEPFNNYDNVLRALRWLNAPDGMNIGARHLTVSTCGIIPGIRKFSKEPEQFTLAISLHSAIQPTRNKLMPGVKKFTLMRLREVLDEYIERTGRRPTYEYALIGGVNDNNPEMDALVDFCRGTLAHVNIIQLNEVPLSLLKPSTDEKANRLVLKLARAGVEATIRNSRGNDIDAACGQLKQRVQDLS